ncbi:cardiolipin synthase [Paenibacillus sp. DMB20]|uniref:cardiolipin synthase n=1 Tax=Paenibacillus sp. DMB20 TaxID=1642570 RepID=UPI0006277BEB|nr:cardiolipin synthase [Paenibacillus sp. DMB20]KKO55571.1 cardiolipin synthase [Paenibacillus sp. DMB20]
MLWIMLALLLFVVQIAFVIYFEYERPEKAMVWLSILFLFPLAGFLLYYFMAKEYLHPPALQRKERLYWDQFKADLNDRCRQRILEDKHGEMIVQDNMVHALLKNLPGPPITTRNETTVFADGGQAFEAILDSLAAAKHHIHIEFYIIRDDRLGTRFEQLLIQKAKEGVKVRILYDGIGSRRLSKAFLNRLNDAGVETGCFFPLFASFIEKRLNYRNHRKIVVVDGKIGFFGGLNIGDEYLGENPKIGYWRDTHFSIEGDAVLWIQYTFLTDWHLVKGQIITDPVYYPIQKSAGKEFVQIVKSGPDEKILDLIFSLIVSARERIYIETPYFIPDRSVLLALRTAAIRGVDVRVIIPALPDKNLVHYAALSYVRELLQAGVRFYTYQNGFIHAKVIISDGLACSGSANMDIRSFCNQFEINAIFYDGTVVDRLVQDFYRDLGTSNELLLSAFDKQGNLQKTMEVFARLLSPLF